MQSPSAYEIVRSAKQDLLRETALKRRSTLELGGDSSASRRNGRQLRPLSPMELPSAQTRDTPNAGSRRELRAQPSPSAASVRTVHSGDERLWKFRN